MCAMAESPNWFSISAFGHQSLAALLLATSHTLSCFWPLKSLARLTLPAHISNHHTGNCTWDSISSTFIMRISFQHYFLLSFPAQIKSDTWGTNFNVWVSMITTTTTQTYKLTTSKDKNNDIQKRRIFCWWLNFFWTSTFELPNQICSCYG